MRFFNQDAPDLPTTASALPGRAQPLATAETHFLSGRPLSAKPPQGYCEIVLGMGCFWGAERIFWQADGVWLTSVGYAGGITPNPTYQEVCSTQTGHCEVVRVIFDPAILSRDGLLSLFWENHNPTQGMRQGNDVGSQYRSAIYATSDADFQAARDSASRYSERLKSAGLGAVTTEIAHAGPYYFAEDYHQQYLAKNPGGYCGLGGTGVSCPSGLDA